MYEALKNVRGCIAASPSVQNDLEEAYLFFFLAFFAAILFSSLLILESSASSKLAERVFNHHV